MVFSSTIFLFLFLPVFLAVYYVTPTRLHSLTIVVGSYIFYAWWRVDYLLLLIAVTVWAYSYDWGDRDVMGYSISVEPGYQFIDFRTVSGFSRHDKRLTGDVEAALTIRRKWLVSLVYQLNDINSNSPIGDRFANHRFGIRFGWLF